MATPESQTEHQPRDTIFRNYSSQQASNYAEGRLGYSEALIEFILKQHNSSGGHNGVVLDVGCGPGLATRMLAPHFDIAYGADPGNSMIEKAQQIGGTSKAGSPIVYKLSNAEDLDKIDGLDHSSVDLITAATAAHWFEMPKFWKAAAKILKPGGTVAIWTAFRQHDTSGDNKVEALIEDFRENVLRPYNSAGSQLTHDGYANLVMPWDDQTTASLYDRELSSRHELSSKDGYLPKTYMMDSKPGDASLDETLQKFRKMLNSFGTVNRWQKANPDLVGTKDDIIEIFMRKLRQAAEDNGGSLDVSSLAERFAIAVIIVKRV
jgi:ubiquinone/menaquinone biosynthesis C-methylase UbiE